MPHKSVWEELNEWMLFAFAVFFTVRLFQRRLGWLFEKVWGFIFFFVVSFVPMMLLSSWIPGATTTVDAERPAGSIKDWWGSVSLLVGLIAGVVWVVFSILTWAKAHTVAVERAEKNKAERKAARRARVRDYLADVLPK